MRGLDHADDARQHGVRPVWVTRSVKLPDVFSVPPVACMPDVFSTGTGSPVSMDSST